MGARRDAGGVRPASATTIEVDFYYQGQRCKERLLWKPTEANLKKARERRQRIIYAIADGVFDYAKEFPDSKRVRQFAKHEGDVLTVKEYLTDWLEGHGLKIKTSTAEGYRKAVNNQLIPAFGTKNLTDLKAGDFETWLSKRDVSNKRIANLLSVARKALADAVKREILDVNVLDGYEFRRPEKPSEDDDVDPFTIEDINAIIAAAVEPQERNLFQFAFWTGLRTSELIGLRWRDIDWNREEVRVNRAVTRAARSAKAEESTKTRAGRRDVKLLAPALAALVAQKPYSLLLEAGDVFLNPRTGKPWSGDQVIRAAWVRILRRAGVRYRNPYQTRHTYASMMVSAGENPVWVAKQMGHSDWSMIARIYGRWMPQADPDAGSRAVAKFGAGETDQQADQKRTKSRQTRAKADQKLVSVKN